MVAKDKPFFTRELSLRPSVEIVCATKGERAGASVFIAVLAWPASAGDAVSGSSQRPFLSAGAGERPDPRLVGGKFRGRS